MTFKVSRVQQKESYNITSGWLSDFASNISKNANIIEVLGRNSREKFATIEDKMKDMKKRVGFDQIEGIKKESRMKKSPCGCSKCDTCDSKKIKRNKLRAIFNHAKNLIEERPEISYMQVVNSCRELPIYQEISNNLKHKIFSSQIRKILNKNKQPDMVFEIEHIPHTEMYQFDFADDMKAPYMRD